MQRKTFLRLRRKATKGEKKNEDGETEKEKLIEEKRSSKSSIETSAWSTSDVAKDHYSLSSESIDGSPTWIWSPKRKDYFIQSNRDGRRTRTWAKKILAKTSDVFHPTESGTLTSPWIWSEAQGCYYRAIRSRKGQNYRYIWSCEANRKHHSEISLTLPTMAMSTAWSKSRFSSGSLEHSDQAYSGRKFEVHVYTPKLSTSIPWIKPTSASFSKEVESTIEPNQYSKIWRAADFLSEKLMHQNASSIAFELSLPLIPPFASLRWRWESRKIEQPFNLRPHMNEVDGRRTDAGDLNKKWRWLMIKAQHDTHIQGSDGKYYPTLDVLECSLTWSAGCWRSQIVPVETPLYHPLQRPLDVVSSQGAMMECSSSLSTPSIQSDFGSTETIKSTSLSNTNLNRRGKQVVPDHPVVESPNVSKRNTRSVHDRIRSVALNVFGPRSAPVSSLTIGALQTQTIQSIPLGGLVVAGAAGTGAMIMGAINIRTARQALAISRQTLEHNKKKDERTLQISRDAHDFNLFKDVRDNPDKPRWTGSNSKPGGSPAVSAPVKNDCAKARAESVHSGGPSFEAPDIATRFVALSDISLRTIKRRSNNILSWRNDLHQHQNGVRGFPTEPSQGDLANSLEDMLGAQQLPGHPALTAPISSVPIDDDVITRAKGHIRQADTFLSPNVRDVEAAVEGIRTALRLLGAEP